MPVERWVIHPQYSKQNQDKDVAIVFLKTALELNGNSIRTIQIIDKNIPVPNDSNVTVTGWGYVEVKIYATLIHKIINYFSLKMKYNLLGGCTSFFGKPSRRFCTSD